MRNFARMLMAWFAVACLGSACAAVAQDRPSVLVYSQSSGWRHTSIETGVEALKRLGAERGIDMVASEDPAIFDGNALDEFDAIVFLNTTTKKDDPSSEWFVGERRQKLQDFVHRGGGIVGIHGASDSHYNWPWFGRLIGGRFASHPPGTPSGEVSIADPEHAATSGLDPKVTRVDEWYYFDDYDPTVHLLATLDPQSIGEADINPNPMSWSHEFEGARVFYTAMGHTEESYADPWLMRHFAQGLDWVLKR